MLLYLLLILIISLYDYLHDDDDCSILNNINQTNRNRWINLFIFWIFSCIIFIIDQWTLCLQLNELYYFKDWWDNWHKVNLVNLMSLSVIFNYSLILTNSLTFLLIHFTFWEEIILLFFSVVKIFWKFILSFIIYHLSTWSLNLMVNY